MTLRGVTICTALAVAVASCSGGDDDAASTTTTLALPSTTTTAPSEREPSTTTTEFDPATVEGEVEAAYLRSWDVYADAVYTLELDEQALSEVFAEELLEVRRREIESRVEEARAAMVKVEHDYEIEITGPDTALIIDSYVNHQVLIDPTSKEPIEPDPNEPIVDAFSARLTDDGWVLFDLERLA